VSYLGSLTEKINSPDNLSFEDQSALLLDLKQALTEEDNKKDAVTVLMRLRKRRDLFAHIGDQIDELLRSADDAKAEPPPVKHEESGYEPLSERMRQAPQEDLDEPARRSSRPARRRSSTSRSRQDRTARQAEQGDGRYSTVVLILMIVGSIFIPLIGIIGGVYAMMKHERKDQAYVLLVVSGIAFFINLMLWSGGGIY
jgi:hypothetical protein